MVEDFVGELAKLRFFLQKTESLSLSLISLCQFNGDKRPDSAQCS